MPSNDQKVTKAELFREIDGLEKRNAELAQENRELRRQMDRMRGEVARRAASPAHPRTMIEGGHRG